MHRVSARGRGGKAINRQLCLESTRGRAPVKPLILADQCSRSAVAPTAVPFLRARPPARTGGQ